MPPACSGAPPRHTVGVPRRSGPWTLSSGSTRNDAGQVPVLQELERDECERLLRRGTFGRVVLVSPRGPEIVPVNYAVDRAAVIVRTSPSGLLARYGHGHPLAFEVDVIDHERWHGWSVVARGVGELVRDAPSAGPGGRRV